MIDQELTTNFFTIDTKEYVQQKSEVTESPELRKNENEKPIVPEIEKPE